MPPHAALAAALLSAALLCTVNAFGSNPWFYEHWCPSPYEVFMSCTISVEVEVGVSDVSWHPSCLVYLFPCRRLRCPKVFPSNFDRNAKCPTLTSVTNVPPGYSPEVPLASTVVNGSAFDNLDVGVNCSSCP